MFWDRFYALCEKQKIKPTQVAKTINIPVGSVTAWKKGTEPNTQALRKIGDYFEVSIDYLLERERETITTSHDETLLIERYRACDQIGKDRICYTAETEEKRTKEDLRKSTA